MTALSEFVAAYYSATQRSNEAGELLTADLLLKVYRLGLMTMARHPEYAAALIQDLDPDAWDVMETGVQRNPIAVLSESLG